MQFLSQDRKKHKLKKSCYEQTDHISVYTRTTSISQFMSIIMFFCKQFRSKFVAFAMNRERSEGVGGANLFTFVLLLHHLTIMSEYFWTEPF